MKSYATLWGIGLVMVILGFSLSLGVGFTWLYALLVVGGFLLGAAGFLRFAKKDQGTV